MCRTCSGRPCAGRVPDISRLAIIFTISANKNANSNINKLINSFISSKRKRVRVPDVRVPDVCRTFSRLGIIFTINSNNDNSNINKPINNSISIQRRKGPCAGRVPDVRVPDVLRTFPGLLSFLLLALIRMLILILINLLIALLAVKGRGSVFRTSVCRTCAGHFPGLVLFLLLTLIGMIIAILISLLIILLAFKGGKVRVPDVFRTSVCLMDPISVLEPRASRGPRDLCLNQSDGWFPSGRLCQNLWL